MDVILLIVFVVGGLMVLSSDIAESRRKKRWAAAKDFSPNESYGSARFATNQDLRKAGLFKNTGLFFGLAPDGRTKLFYQKAGHMAVICAARGGKLLTVLVPYFSAGPVTLPADRRSKA